MYLSITAIVQARTSSSRLPGKVLLPILGRPMLLHQLDRISRSDVIEQLVVATSLDPSDDILASTIESAGYSLCRGNLNDVLSRFLECSTLYNSSTIVRLTGDCPLIDSASIDEVIRAFLSSDCDYLSNTFDETKLTIPDGFDVEVFGSDLLLEASQYALLPSEREHVTPWMRRSDIPFKSEHFMHRNASPFYRLTVDDQRDFDLVSYIFNSLYPTNPYFDLNIILDFLARHPDIASSNINTIRNEGYARSLLNDP